MKILLIVAAVIVGLLALVGLGVVGGIGWIFLFQPHPADDVARRLERDDDAYEIELARQRKKAP